MSWSPVCGTEPPGPKSLTPDQSWLEEPTFSLCRIFRRHRRPVSRFDQNQFSGWPDALSAPPQEAPKSPGGEGGAPDSTSKEEEEEKDSPTLNLPDKEYIENCRRAIAISLKRAAADRSLVLPPPEREESPSKVKNMLACSLSSSYYYICMATTNMITCLPYRIPACRIALPDNSKSCSSHLACLLSWFRPLHIC